MTYAERCRRVALLIRLRDILRACEPRDAYARGRRAPIRRQIPLPLREVA